MMVSKLWAMQNTVECESGNAVRKFQNPCRNYKNVGLNVALGLMMWATTQDTRQKTMFNKTDYREVTVCRNDQQYINTV